MKAISCTKAFEMACSYRQVTVDLPQILIIYMNLEVTIPFTQ
jgi:hypothetical protein